MGLHMLSLMEHMLEKVREAQNNVAVKEAHYHDGVGDRDRAIWDAKEAGASVIQIAEATGLTRQQVYKILANFESLPEAC